MQQTHRTMQIIRLLTVAFTLVASVHSFAQQDPLYSLYLNNPLLINPAYTGMNNNLTMFAGYRSQWAGFDGSPTTLTAGAHSSLWKNKMAAGFVVVSDRIGENTNTQVTGSYAYKLPINTGTTLSFGMQAGFMNYKVDPSQLTLQNPTDPLFVTINQMTPSIGVGVMLKSDRYLVGLSVPRLVNGTFDLGGQKINVYEQHYYLLGSYLFHVSERIILKPSVLLKAVKGAPLSTDLNFNVIINRNYSAGIYTRNFKAYGILASVNFLDKFRLAYALEVPTNQSVGTRYVTNEIMFSLRMSALSFQGTEVSNF